MCDADMYEGLDPSNPADLDEILLRQAIQLSLMDTGAPGASHYS